MADNPSGVFDAAVHPRMLGGRQIYDYLKEPYKGLVYNSPNRFFHPTPTGIAPYGEWLEQSRPDGEIVTTAAGPHTAQEPGSVPARTTGYLRENGVRQAILNPMLRGLQPAADQGSAICAAYNDWIASTWLQESTEDLGYLGTIRVNPMDPEGAVREIERWAGHPRMVQVGVPLEAHHPYGQRYYIPVWEAAVAKGLPVAIKAEGGVGVEYFPTMTGLPRTHIEFSALHRDRFFFHLASFIAEGMFDRFPGLRILFADGGFDMLTPAMWRMDMDWPITRTEVPWVKQLPSDYLRAHVRFVTNRLEGPPDSEPEIVAEWARRTDAAHLLVYGSGYPVWSSVRPEQVLTALSDEDRERILRGNALELYASQLATA
ncbi:amidohydrolase family protein [Streptomyces fuscichromogenes]|uniref:amidohydrolase family protein n=1 Tax=Streptomyces fuscichromogenes TaxID=1324013 RepID=UPI00382C7A54